MRSRRRRSVVVGWVLLAMGVAGAIVVGLLPSPYVVEEPGPVYNTLGSAPTNSGGEQKLIRIPVAKTYPTSGTLDMLTVSVVGSPAQPLSWSGVAAAWFDPSKAIVPSDEIYAVGETQKESDEESAQEMTTSQQEAVAAALRKLGYTVPGIVVVESVLSDGAAKGILDPGDEILRVNGTAVQDATALRALILKSGAGHPLSLLIRRDGAERTVSVTPKVGNDGTGKKVPLVGIIPGATYAYPVKVEIHLDDVGGPSAGMMFALGIIDELTPGKMTGGQRIAGTGEIDAAGDVSAIGGIRQKMFGAQRAGARWFLAPASNCDEVVGHIPAGLTVYAVSNLDQAVTAVHAIASGNGRDRLATCSAGSDSQKSGT